MVLITNSIPYNWQSHLATEKQQKKKPNLISLGLRFIFQYVTLVLDGGVSRRNQKTKEKWSSMFPEKLIYSEVKSTSTSLFLRNSKNIKKQKKTKKKF